MHTNSAFLKILLVLVLVAGCVEQSQPVPKHRAGGAAATVDAVPLATFSTTVSNVYATPDVVMVLANSSMDTDWFVGHDGGRTVYSSDVYVGKLVHGTGNIMAHATWVINYNSDTRTVNLNKNKTHITNWWGNQRCQVYEDGTCNCHSNPNWNICAALPGYVTILHSAAVAARINARHFLTQAGYTVTNN